jgi:hypothetical protein
MGMVLSFSFRGPYHKSHVARQILVTNAKNQELIEKLKQGIDPRASKHGAVVIQSNGDVKQELDSDDTKEKSFEDMTIADLVTDYLKFVNKNKASTTYRHYSDTLNTFILKPWKARLAKDLKKSDAYVLVKKIAARVKNDGDTTEGMARAVIKVGSAMFAWKIKKEDDPYLNPFEKVKAIEEVEIIMHSSKKPLRALDDKEIKTFWNTTNSLDGPEAHL